MGLSNEIRVVQKYCPHAEVWVVDAIDYYIVTQAKNKEDLPEALGHALFAHILMFITTPEATQGGPVESPNTHHWQDGNEYESTTYNLGDIIPFWFGQALHAFFVLKRGGDSERGTTLED